MFFLEYYFNTIVYHDFINKFSYKTLKQIPKLKKITLNFGYRKVNLKYIISGLLALECLTHKRGNLTKSKRLNISLKIKKGNPVGCKIILYKKFMYLFYFKLRISIFEKIKSAFKTKAINSISIKLKTPLVFNELENHYQFFKNLTPLDVTLSTNTKSQNEFKFLLKSLKLL